MDRIPELKFLINYNNKNSIKNMKLHYNKFSKKKKKI